MNAANDNRIVTTERKVQILTYSIEKMVGELVDADGARKAALLKLIQMGRKRLSELRTLH